MKPIQRFVRWVFGLPELTIDHDHENLVLARRWRAAIENRLNDLEDRVKVIETQSEVPERARA